MSLYVIRHGVQAERPEYFDIFWSNDDGWTDLEYATVFTQKERDTLHLPFGGEWIRLPEAK